MRIMMEDPKLGEELFLTEKYLPATALTTAWSKNRFIYVSTQMSTNMSMHKPIYTCQYACLCMSIQAHTCLHKQAHV